MEYPLDMSCSRVLLGIILLFPGFYAALYGLLAARADVLAVGAAMFAGGAILIWRGRGKRRGQHKQE
jgi:uncharacterized membrane protein HdeD (DUF308 family)